MIDQKEYRTVYVWHYGLSGCYMPDSSYYFETETERNDFIASEIDSLSDNPDNLFDPYDCGYEQEIDNNMFTDEELDQLLEGDSW